ncbi:MAG: tyrosine phosphatase family protein [Hyphomicrobiaceae bacterium]
MVNNEYNAGSRSEIAADIHVCSLARLNEVVATVRASHIITAINPWSIPETPPGIAADDHLKLAMNDIVDNHPGLVTPASEHIAQLLDFASVWNRQGPLVIHCLAGVSRSTAAAFIVLCKFNPATSEHSLARALRRKSPSAQPNQLMIELADELLSRDGRMIEAIEAIGPGNPTLEGHPFSIESSIA